MVFSNNKAENGEKCFHNKLSLWFTTHGTGEGKKRLNEMRQM